MFPGFLNSILFKDIEQLKDQRHRFYADPTFMPVKLNGGIGDVINSIDAIKELSKQIKIVLYTKHLETFRYFYKEPILAFEEVPDFTWYLQFDTCCKFFMTDQFHGFQHPTHDELFVQQMRRFQDNPQLEALTKNPTLNGKYFLMARMGKELQMNRQQFSWYSLGFNDKLTYEPLPRRAAKGYITIHDGFDLSNRHIVTGRATKTWDWAHWNQFVYIFKEMFPRVKVIQLGRADTARAIDGVDECLIDETTITEAFDILSRSSLHIDGDSGLLHAATRMQIPTIGIYGPSDPAFYGYPQNMNLRSGVCEQFCNGSKDTWMDKCAIGYTTPKCMDATTPTRVLEVVKQFFNSEGTKNEISKTADSYRRIPMVEARRCSGSD